MVCHILTDTDSTALQFIIVSDPNSDFPESKIRDIFFEVVTSTKIYNRFDTSHPSGITFRQEKKKEIKN